MNRRNALRIALAATSHLAFTARGLRATPKVTVTLVRWPYT